MHVLSVIQLTALFVLKEIGDARTQMSKISFRKDLSYSDCNIMSMRRKIKDFFSNKRSVSSSYWWKEMNCSKQNRANVDINQGPQ